MTVIHRQEILQDISFFTSTPKAKFYDALFAHLDVSVMEKTAAHTGRKGFPKAAMLRAFIVMKCEGFSQITDLVDFLNNNLIIAHDCCFNIMKSLPSYWTFDRFLRDMDNTVLKELMQTQVQLLYERGILDTSFIGLDSTPVAANTSQNNPKSFQANKFSKEHQPKSDPDCRLGVHTASNQHSEKNYSFYWGYKSHVLVDCISGLPLYEMTTPANIADSTVALDVLSRTDSFLPLRECTFIGDKGYDVKAIYNTVKTVYHGDCVIPLNARGSKNPKTLLSGNIICQAGLAMHKDGKDSSGGRCRQKFCCPFRKSKDDAACPCNHPRYFNGKRNRGCTKYITLPDDYRLSIDRSCIAFKSVYALRTECERYNSRFKAAGQERLWVRSLAAAQNLNSITHIALLAVAAAAVSSQSAQSFRCLKSVKRTA